MNYYVYLYLDPRTKLPFYVGKGTGDRMYVHLKENKSRTENYKKWAYIKGLRNKGLEPIVRKYTDGLSENHAYEIEEELISIWGRRDLDDGGILTNICQSNRPPSAVGRVLSENTKRKISEAQSGVKGYWFGKSSPQRGISKMMGTENPFYGQSHSDETREIMSMKRRERYENGITEGMTGKNHSTDTKNRLSEIKKDQMVNGLADKIRNIIVDKVGVEYHVVEPDGTEYTIKGLPAFAKEKGLPLASLRAVIHRRKQGHDTKYRGWVVEKKV